mmetsp:Transcript_11714/g.19774  ORF Transcript_11714/g.19774 Transcript_11714/m.19774 type:complete len:332 (+) Transcript_11714:151-1146(+)
MLLTVGPLTTVTTVVRPDELAVALLLVLVVLTDVLAAISPGEGALAVHLVVEPLSLVAAVVDPGVDAAPMDIIVIELARVLGAVGPHELPQPVLLPVLVVALEHGVVWPGLHSEPVLSVISPLPCVLGPVDMLVGAHPVGLVVEPVAIVNVAIGVNESPPTIGLVTLPVALVDAAILPDLVALALSKSVGAPLAAIHDTVVKLERILPIDLAQLSRLVLCLPVETVQLLVDSLDEGIQVFGHTAELASVRVTVEESLPLLLHHLSARLDAKAAVGGLGDGVDFVVADVLDVSLGKRRLLAQGYFVILALEVAPEAGLHLDDLGLALLGPAQ